MVVNHMGENNMNADLITLSASFSDEEKAIETLESIRWPNGPVCPHCGHEKAYHLKRKPGTTTRSKRKLWKCASCRKQFSVQVGTIFEDSHVPLNKWLAAFYLMCSSKKGISAKQLQRSLSVSYKTAWFLAHRIRHAMSKSPLAEKLKGVVEVDETYIGGKGHGKRGRGAVKKAPVVSLIQRDGMARSFRVDNVRGNTLKGLVRREVEGEAIIMTDAFPSYRGLDKEFAAHGVVNHDQEYVRGVIHTNFAESYFSLLKRGIVGAFHHISRQHMDLYLNEFDFRWNTRSLDDGRRFMIVLRNSFGKRLTYCVPVGKA